MKKYKVLFLLIFFSTTAFAQSKTLKSNSTTKVAWVAHIMRQSESRIPELNFFSTTVPVVLVPNENELRPLVEFRYKYEKEGWTIKVQNAPGKLSGPEANVYSLFAFLNSQISEVHFSAIGPGGERQTEIVYLFAPEAQEFQVVSTWNSLVGYFGVGNIIYEQSGFGVLNAKTALLGLNYMSADSADKFGIASGLQMTVATFESAPIKANPQLIQGHVAGTMRLSFNEATRWRHKFLFGVSYTSLLSNGSPFGFDSLIAPEIGIISQYYMNTRLSYLMEARAVLLEDASFMAQRGLHGQFTLSQTLKSARKQEWALHLSTTDYSSEGQKIAAHFVGLTLGYSF